VEVEGARRRLRGPDGGPGAAELGVELDVALRLPRPAALRLQGRVRWVAAPSPVRGPTADELDAIVGGMAAHER